MSAKQRGHGSPSETGGADATGDAADTAGVVREARPLESSEGVDLTLVRWCLSLTPLQRLHAAESSIRSLLELKRESGRP